MILNLVSSDDPILRVVAAEVDLTDINGEDITKIVKLLTKCEDMLETMYANGGVGLAANQVGWDARVFVYDTGKEGEKGILINPVLQDQSMIEQSSAEGCLSLPGKRGDVMRPRWVMVTGYTFVEGRCEVGATIIHADALLARVFQHEIDHLNGILFTDKVIPGTLVENSSSCP